MGEMMKFARRAAIALTGVVMAGGLATATAGSASATTQQTAMAGRVAPADCVINYVPVYNGSTFAGDALWNANPDDCANGDNLGAFDDLTDGYSVVAHLSTGRRVATSGYTAPSPIIWKGGDLPEGHLYHMWGCLSKNGVESQCTREYDVYS
ncbi:hypothetical protein [Streptomyces sp. CA2R106]|uniref:hypothetical protein n=2 Tax=Streptomycetaceae TaxID=2062 RepID=UPI00300A832A